MALIINVGSVHPLQIAARVTTSLAFSQPGAAISKGDVDTVQLSQHGRVLSNAVENSTFRIARLKAVRSEIEAGTYETPERIRGTVERLLDVVC